MMPEKIAIDARDRKECPVSLISPGSSINFAPFTPFTRRKSDPFDVHVLFKDEQLCS